MNRDLAGGVYTDLNRQVLDTQGNLLGGVFVVGFSSSRDLYASGISGASSVGEAVVTGRVARSYLAQELNNNPSSRSFLKTGPPENSPAGPVFASRGSPALMRADDRLPSRLIRLGLPAARPHSQHDSSVWLGRAVAGLAHELLGRHAKPFLELLVEVAQVGIPYQGGHHTHGGGRSPGEEARPVPP